jgi:hypothetical protein
MMTKIISKFNFSLYRVPHKYPVIGANIQIQIQNFKKNKKLFSKNHISVSAINFWSMTDWCLNFHLDTLKIENLSDY